RTGDALELIGTSVAVSQLRQTIEKVSPTNSRAVMYRRPCCPPLSSRESKSRSGKSGQGQIRAGNAEARKCRSTPPRRKIRA
ncbi:hypothetical protein EOD29_34455, partial [Mesorhizobium sp. M1A.T.Ca.IN.004.03.1.1]